MPYRRRRIKRATLGKESVKKSGTLITSPIGPASPISQLILIDTPVRSTTGSEIAIREGQDTGSSANVGNVIKYVNIHIQSGARDAVEPEDDTSGWLEWGIVKYKEIFTLPPNTNLGTNTLGDTLTKQYRGDCLLTGNVPVGGDTPNNAEIMLKLPKNFCKMQLGSQLVMYWHFRSVNNASTAIDLNMTVVSYNYKLYF